MTAALSVLPPLKRQNCVAGALPLQGWRAADLQPQRVGAAQQCPRLHRVVVHSRWVIPFTRGLQRIFLIFLT
jgi:hypothetical protein